MTVKYFIITSEAVENIINDIFKNTFVLDEIIDRFETMLYPNFPYVEPDGQEVEDYAFRYGDKVSRVTPIPEMPEKHGYKIQYVSFLFRYKDKSTDYFKIYFYQVDLECEFNSDYLMKQLSGFKRYKFRIKSHDPYQFPANKRKPR